jgi:hypothetical protein
MYELKFVQSLSMDHNIEYAQNGVFPGRFFLAINNQIVFLKTKAYTSYNIALFSD